MHTNRNGARGLLARPLLLREAHGFGRAPGGKEPGGHTPAPEPGRPAVPEPGHTPAPAPGPEPGLLIRGDNLEVLRCLCSGPLREHADKAGGLKLVYLDPPFAVGADFYTDASFGGPRTLAYRDVWPGGLSGYLAMMRERLVLARRALAANGCLFLHCDSRVSHHLRLLLDEIFGPERFLGEIIWHYTGGGRARRWFSRKHDSIFHYAVSDSWTFDPDAVRVPYKPGSGYARSGITSARGKRYLPNPLGTPVDDVWDIPMVNPLSRERSGFPTQKPLPLLSRILAACSRPGDLTADFFCGSGTLALAAARLGRAWICVDQSPLAVQTARERLLALPEPPAFLLAEAAEERQALAEPELLQASLPSGTVRYRLRPRFAPQKRGKGRAVRLEGLDVDLEGPAPPGNVPPPGPGWLRFWTVGAPAGPDFASDWLGVDFLSQRALWQTTGGKKGVPPQSAELPGKGRLIVCLADIFGNTTRLLLE